MMKVLSLTKMQSLSDNTALHVHSYDPGNIVLVTEKDETKADTPVRRKIQIGKVASLKGQFDRLARKEENDIDLKRLKRSCPKPLTPGSSKRGKKSGRISSKVKIDKNQRSIRDYYRGDEGAE